MINPDQFWKTLELNTDRSTIMHDWNAALGETLEVLKIFLHPTEEHVQSYPNPIHPKCHPYYVVAHRNGTYQAVSENRDHVIDLEPNDIVKYRWDMLRFRKLLADVLKINPASDTIKKLDCTIRLGNLAVAPGEEYPVYMELVDRRNFFKDDVNQLLLKLKTPFIVVTGIRMFWDDALVEVLRERNIPLLALSEVLEFRDDQFIATDVWHGAVEAFRKTLSQENLVAVPEYEFARRGGWSLRFGFEKKEPTVLPGDLLGAFYIQRLLMFPHKEIHVTMLLAEIAGDDQLRVAMDGQEVIDQQARQNYIRRLEELAADRCEAERNEDESWLERIDRETDQITDELLKSTGLGGKTRKLGDDIQNIRRRIAKTINEVIEKINENDSHLARHLKNSIHTNIEMCYRPDREIAWVFN